MTTMQTTPQAVDVIKAFEGFRPEPYYDSAGVITIGYGTARTYKDGHPIQLGDQIDEPSAELELVGHVRENVEPAMARIFSGVPLTFPQRDALASFVYNLGGGNPKKYETLVKLVKERRPDAEIMDQLVKYRLAGGQRQLGLYRRRLAECCVWLGKPWEPAMNATWNTNWRELADFDDPDLVIPEPPSRRQRFRGRPRRDTAPTPPSRKRTVPEAPKPTPSQDSPAAPISPNTRQAEDVPYRIRRDAGLKPLEESKRAMGYVYQQVGTATVRIGAGMGLGGFGYVAQDPVLSTALVALFVVGAVFVTGWVLTEYGRWKRERGEEEAQQGLY